MATQVGALRHFVTVQHQATTEDAIGQQIGGWSKLCDLWADIRHPSGLEQTRADAVISKVRASIRVRQRGDITAAMRVLHGGTVYDIKAVLPDAQSRAWMDLVCEVAT